MRPFPRTLEELRHRRRVSMYRSSAMTRQILGEPRVQCAWCGAAMSQDLVPEERVSHGMCPKCFEQFTREIPQ